MKRQKILTGVLVLVILPVMAIVLRTMSAADAEVGTANDVTWTLASTGLPDTGDAEAIAFGDYDNDGKLDLFAGHSGAGIKLWLNDGTPAWGASVPITTTGAWYGLATADLNRDGLLDVAASDGTSVHIYEQNGAGGWIDEIPIDNTGAFYEVAIGDLNDDGSLDIVAANHSVSGNGIQIWANYAGFWDGMNPPDAPGPFWGVTLGDFNGDGHLDIAAGKDSASGGVYVWRGNGNEGWFSASTGLPDGTNAWRDVAFGDFDYDGKLDLAATSDQGIKVWTGNGYGTWTEAATGLPATGSYAGLALGDLDNDGWLDLAAVRADGSSIEPWRNTGGYWELFTQPDSSSAWWNVALADVDNDGILDLGATSQSNQGVRVWVDGGASEPAGNWRAITSPASSGSQSAIVAADLNGDGYLDIVAAMGDSAGIQAWSGDGSNTWVDCNTLTLPSFGTYNALALGYLTNDAFPELFVGSGDNYGISVYQNAGCYWTLWGSGLPITGSYNALALGDVDHDDSLDLVGALSGGGLHTWEAIDSMNWAAGAVVTSTSTYSDIALGDLDNDGELDIAAANYHTDSLGVRVWLYAGAIAPWTTSVVVTSTGQYAAIALGDLNNDGALDVAAAKNGAPDQQGIYLWLSDNTGSLWTPFASPTTTGQYYDLDLVDFNHDGSLDLLVASEGSGVDVWAGDGAGNWVESSTNLPTTGDFFAARFGHIDHDGLPDLLTAQSNGGIRLWTAGEATPPGNWGSISPAGWLTTQTLTFTTQALDTGSGLDVSTAQYAYSTDSGVSWSSWLSATMSASDGVTTSQTMTTSAISFGQDSGATHLNRVRFRVADVAGNVGESPIHYIQIDSTPPNIPTTLTGDRLTGVWSKDDTPTMVWSGASDETSGVRGYSYEWSTSPDAVPDDTLDTISTVASPAMPGDGDGWYFHVRTVDWAPLWADGAIHDGPYWLDITPPSNPTDFSSNPAANAWTNDDTIYVSWSGASDGSGSGVYGYSYEWSTSSSVLPDTIVETTANNITSAPLGASDLWYFHIRTLDQVGNWSSDAATYGLFYVDVDAPSSSASSPSSVSIGGFTVSWSGSDSGGSGYALRYDVQYKDTTLGAGWTNWKNDTTLTSGYFIGDPGHIYQFRSRARDGAGNQEPWPYFPDTTTEVAMLDFDPFALEVTQAVQDLNNSVVLVANKRTFARLHVDVQGWGDHGPMTARLRAWRGATYLGSITPNNPGGAITVRKNPNRSYLDHSFYFDLPSSWLDGTVTLVGEIDPYNRWADTNDANDTHQVIVTFHDTPEIEVILFDVFYNLNNITYHVSTGDRLALGSWLRRIYPVPDVNVYLAWMGPYEATTTVDDDGNTVMTYPTCETVNSHLLWHKTNNTLGLNEPWTSRYYGMVSQAGEFMRGCAAGIPGYEASGPSTSGNEWYGSHELGHTYNQVHTRGNQPPSCGDCTSDNCGPWGRCGCEDGGVARYPNGDISPSWTGDNALYGFDIETIEVYPPSYKDNMTYCQPEWISDIIYESIRARIVAELGTQVQARSAITQEHLAVFGAIYTATGQVELDAFYRVPDSWDVLERAPGDYSIRLLDSGDSTLADYPFTPKSSHLEPGPSPCQLRQTEEERPAQIAEFVPWVTGTARIAIYHGSQELASRAVSDNAPQVTLTSPNGGEVLDGSQITVTWTASDADGDDLEFTLEYSVDGGAHWRTLGSGITGASWLMDASFVPGADQGRFRIVATDGVNTTRDESDGDFTVPNKAPVVQIVSPSDGATYVPEASVALVASTIDVEDGALDDAALAWTSSLSETVRAGRALTSNLGTGRMIHITDFITGTHIITLTATDSGGQQVSSAVTIHIASPVFTKEERIYLPLLLRHNLSP